MYTSYKICTSLHKIFCRELNHELIEKNLRLAIEFFKNSPEKSNYVASALYSLSARYCGNVYFIS